MGAEESCLRKVEKSGVHSDLVSFTINGKEHLVKTNYQSIGPQSRLVDYIRDEAGLKGTKVMCREGGCGACVVNVKSKDMNTGKITQRAVNSCLTPVLSCDGWDICTIEGIGNRKDGYHPIQERLAKFGGTQCGFCSPGMCMNMHGLMKSKNGQLKEKDVEDNFDGNICRCTGYRPILDAFKSFAEDASPEIRQRCKELDIEDMKRCPLIEEEKSSKDPPALLLNLKSGSKWIRPTNLISLFEAIKRGKSSGSKLRIIAGNTGMGVFKNDADSANFFIDVTGIPEMSKIKITPNSISLGAGVKLTETIKVLRTTAASNPKFKYVQGISKHLERVANAPVRNAASIGGNLMMKHAHNDFESDVFLLLECVGAEVRIAIDGKNEKTMTILDFLHYDMEHKVILSINFLPINAPGCVFRTFKVGKRNQNAHAFINAAFLFHIDEKNFKVLDQPKILYGGINEKFVHASETEKFFVGKSLNDQGVLKNAMAILDKELVVEVKDTSTSAQFKKTLSQSLLYKVILGALGEKSARFKSGAEILEYPVTSGKQTYDSDEKVWPINKPVPKLEAMFQVSVNPWHIFP